MQSKNLAIGRRPDGARRNHIGNIYLTFELFQHDPSASISYAAWM